MSSKSFKLLLLLYYLAADLYSLVAVRIEKLLIPDVIQSGSTAILDCEYANAGDQFTLQWLFNSSSRPVYEWRPGYEPVVQGILDGTIDLTYKVSPLLSEERRAIRITAVSPDMSGDFTCRVQAGGGGQQARLTKSLLVYSPEKDFTLTLHRHNNSVQVRCDARGFYPQAELTIEFNGVTYPKQQQRVWRSDGVLFDAESTAAILLEPSHTSGSGHVTCRLQLLQAGYTAMKRELLCFEEKCEHNTSSWIKSGVSTVLVMLATLSNLTQR